ncbi:MAG TPA: hypothetical protein VFF07_08900 [Actinomycetota bacterium]|nr:hypothetical protein [Actinomycetota bacterium]
MTRQVGHDDPPRSHGARPGGLGAHVIKAPEVWVQGLLDVADASAA